MDYDWTRMTAAELIARGHKPVAIKHSEEHGWTEDTEPTQVSRLDYTTKHGINISIDPLSAISCCITDYLNEQPAAASNAILAGLGEAHRLLVERYYPNKRICGECSGSTLSADHSSRCNFCDSLGYL